MGATASRVNGKGSVQIKRVGGLVQEVHRLISVQEVMLQNPKHWVAKPDVFRSQNPVSKVLPPEAVLMQGQTVLLVPFKTVQGLLERQHMCPASLDHLMDRPGLAIREWYQQHQNRIAVACPVKNCKCPYVKKDSSESSVALSAQSVQTHEVGVSPGRTHRVGNSSAIDVKPCMRWKKRNLKCLKDGGNQLSKDVMQSSSNRSNEVNMPLSTANFMNDVKHENQLGIEKNRWHSNEEVFEKRASKGSIASDKNHKLPSRNDVKHENIASFVPKPGLERNLQDTNKEISRHQALKKSITSHKKHQIPRQQASTLWHCNEGKSSELPSENVGFSHFFWGACMHLLPKLSFSAKS